MNATAVDTTASVAVAAHAAGAMIAVTVKVSRMAADISAGAPTRTAAATAPAATKQTPAPSATNADAIRAGTPSLSAPMNGTYSA